MGFPRSAGLPRDLKMHPDVSSCGSVIDGIAFQYQTVTKEIVMKLDSKSGATLAAAAATLFLAGAVVSTGSTTANAADGKCMAANACKGMSACKGQGFAKMSEAKCKATGGAYVKG